MFRALSLAARTWARTPSLTGVVIVTLALGIGATTTAFSVAYSVLVQPLPFPQADRLAWITSYNTELSNGAEFVDNSNRMAQFLDWRESLRSFEQLGAWSGTATPEVVTVTGAGSPERVNGLQVTQQLLPMLGAVPEVGRLFLNGEDAVGAPAGVVLSHGYWQRRFGGRPDVIGQAITVDNEPHAVIGVMSADFPLSDSLFAAAPIDLFVPLVLDGSNDADFGYFMTVIGRLRRGASLEQARAELRVRQRALAASRPTMAPVTQKVDPLAGPVADEARLRVLLLFSGVACVLFMACANLANLLLVRASGRRREMQLRAALGATTGRVFTQTLAESAVVVMLGAAAGIALAAVLVRILRAATWLDLPRLAEVHIGWTAIAFAVIVGAVTTMVFGSVPLLYLRRRDLMDSLRPHAGVTAPRRAIHTQRFALAAQVAVALLLTVTGGLLLRSLVGLLRVDPGFRADGVVAMRVDPAGRLPMFERFPFFTQVLDRVAAVPGVESAAMTMNLPMDRNMTWDVMLPDRPYNAATDGAFARLVSSGYFETVGIRILAGRDFDSRDQRAAPWVMAINETLARQLSALGKDPLDTTFTVNGNPRRVVAVVADVKHQTLGGDSGREFYIPQAQAPAFFQSYDMVFRAADPLALAIQEAIWNVSRDQAIGAPIALQQLVDRTLLPHRLLTWLLGGFAVTSLLLAGLGVYGVVAYRVGQRQKEIAIRVALGSPLWRITSVVLRDTLAFVAIGIVIGVPLALVAAGFVRSYLFGVDTKDAVTLATAGATVLTAALLAAALPARRAPRVDPLAALRAD